MRPDLEPARPPRRVAKDAPPSRSRLAWGHAMSGIILAMLGWIVAGKLRLTDAVPFLRSFQYDLFAVAVLGAVIGLTPLRRALWVLNGLLCAAVLVIAYTPLVVGPTRALVRQDAPHPCEAVVVLSSGMFPHGSLIGVQEDRMVRALELIRQGYAKRLVLTRLPRRYPSSLPAVRRQMAALGVSAPIEEVGPCVNTHDEALLVSALARERGWKQVLLVTGPTHTRRARATFLKAGLPVLVQPSAERRYELSSLNTPDQRLYAFSDWIYETAGWYVYQRRGWV